MYGIFTDIWLIFMVNDGKCLDIPYMDPMGMRKKTSNRKKSSPNHWSGQIITTSAEVTPNGGLVRASPQNALNSGLGIILNCLDWWLGSSHAFFQCDV